MTPPKPSVTRDSGYIAVDAIQDDQLRAIADEYEAAAGGLVSLDFTPESVHRYRLKRIAIGLRSVATRVRGIRIDMARAREEAAELALADHAKGAADGPRKSD